MRALCWCHCGDSPPRNLEGVSGVTADNFSAYSAKTKESENPFRFSAFTNVMK
jgi:hypothetical protein